MTDKDPQTVLEENIQEAIRVLAPKFEITPQMLVSFIKPQIEVQESPIRRKPLVSALYDPINIKFTFRQDMIRNAGIIGHEVGHYLHDMVNEGFQEDIFDSADIHFRSKRYWLGIQTKELVGRYSEIVYLKLCGQPFTPWQKGEHLDNGAGAALHDLAIELGYRRADIAFTKYGDTFLPKIVKMNLDEAVEVLPREFPVGFYERRIMPIIAAVKRKSDQKYTSGT